ncbi:MAG: tripartite tricarboxylate transporter permease [Bacillota bacterium]
MEDLIAGLFVNLHIENLAMIMVGTIVGVIFGAIPGVGPMEGVALLIPMTYIMTPIQALLFLVALYSAGTYGGSITAVLFRIPGSAEAVMTTLDGYEMAKKGQAGKALGIAISSSAFGGLFGVMVMILLAPILAGIALRFGPAEYFALCVLGLSVMPSVGTSQPTKAVVAGLFGLFLSTVGMDPISGALRFTFGNTALIGGIPFISSMIGLFAATELLNQITTYRKDRRETAAVEKIRSELPGLRELLSLRWTLLRGAIIGTWVGILPGVGATTAAIIGYSQEVRLSKHPERFGTGIAEGIAAPESANNAAVGGAMIPLLSLGIPGSGTTAVMVGAFLIHGLRLGPLLMVEHRPLVYALFGGMLLSNIMMVVVGLVACRYAAKILSIPYPFLATVIASFCIVGSYALGDIYGIWFVISFAIIGYLMGRTGFPTAPVILGYVLGPIAEASFRRAFIIAGGDVLAIVTRPITFVLLLLAVLSFLWPSIAGCTTKRRKGAV